MKIPNPRPVKMALGTESAARQSRFEGDPAVACLILFGDNYTSFFDDGPLEFKESF
jgi:hypothetical protein